MVIQSKNRRYIAKEKGKEDEIVSNFVYRIIADTIHINPDYSSEHYYTIKGINEHGNRLPEITISVQEYEQMRWPAVRWGSNAVVLNKSIFSLKVREKVLTLSKYKIKQQTKYLFVGYVQNGKQTPFFVDNGGSISAKDHDATVKSHLTGKLANYNLPAPIKDKEDIQDCINEVLEMTELSPNNPFIGILCQTSVIRPFISIFAPITSSNFLIGQTGSRKSALGAVIQSFSGPTFSQQTQLPAEWEDTENALEATSIIVRNSTLVIDDLVPTAETIKPLVNKANRVFRGSANQQARQRSNTNGSLQKGASPGASVLATGESINLPLADSLLNRIVFFSISKNDIDLDELTRYQKLGDEGVLAQFSSLLISYLLARYEGLKTWVPTGINSYRKRAREELENSVHPRVHENIAAIMVSTLVLYKFALSKKVISKYEYDDLKEELWQDLLKLAIKQRHIPNQTTLPNLVFKYLKKGLLNGLIHLTDYSSNDIPDVKNTGKLGWIDDEPQGLCIGWYDQKTKGVYIKTSHDVFSLLLKLIPKGFAQHAPREPKKFWKRMSSLDGLAAMEDGGNRVRKTNPETKESMTVYSLACRII